ncbi:gluconate kinase [Listeria floridensis FSL S10-1187]|uniref:Gluconate kinase n=1 Tax=Listeria floridensis FSL S10-1187 TaxID=1265817 RepID=A0ABN0REA4_9LIST|nr:gluconokinase [Listeria floridensis]EUJ30932.1 gluconate kinase [Listeria floridensis FSL S10-1187]
MSEFFMGVDIGTSSTKAVLFTDKGELVTRYAVHYELDTDATGKAELDPDEIVQAVAQAVWMVMEASRIERSELAAISFSAAMHSLILIDSENKPLTKCLTWADGRSASALERAKQRYELGGLYMTTGTPLHVMSPFAKLLWLNEVAPDKMHQAARVCGIKSYVLHELFGEWVIDAALASGTGFFNTKENIWEQTALDLVNLTEERLPQVVSEEYCLSGLKPGWAERLNVAQETNFIVGGSDGALASLGIQALGAQDVTVTVGTSGAVRKLGQAFLPDQQKRTFCYRLSEDYFVRGGAVNNGGKTVEWALRELAPAELKEQRDYRKLMEQAENISLGADGLLFFPYLLGERAPYWTSDIRGAFFGLAEWHTQAHMIRAVIEGVALNLYSVYQAISDPEDKLYVTGGIAAHPFWCQLLADVFGREVRVPHTIEGSSLGAAIVAMKALGKLTGLELPNKPEISASYRPNEVRHQNYRSLHDIFADASEAVIKTSHKIVRWQKEESDRS